MAVVVRESVILANPILQGLAILRMIGEIASLLIRRMAVPVIYFMAIAPSQSKNKLTQQATVVPDAAALPAPRRAKFVQSFPNPGERGDPSGNSILQRMKRVIDMSEVLGTVEGPEGAFELCAAADAGFDEGAGRLVVKLEAFLRPAGYLAKERHFGADWLPANETVTESVAREEGREVAREVFHRWVRRVREAAPPLHHA